MRLFGRTITISVERDPPIVGAEYHHKSRDPHDMIEYVIPQQVSGGSIIYAKIYKDPNMRVEQETISVAEFHKWFRRGR